MSMLTINIILATPYNAECFTEKFYFQSLLLIVYDTTNEHTCNAIILLHCTYTYMYMYRNVK